jgi:hypothetical protein
MYNEANDGVFARVMAIINDKSVEPGQCIMCREHDEDVVKCIDSHCGIDLHPGCGKRCEGCHQVICDTHVIYIYNDPHCSDCAEEATAILFVDDVLDCIVASLMEEEQVERKIA